MYRTVLIERHPAGALFVATDSTLLIAAWAAEKFYDPAPMPDIDSAPLEAFLVSDADERGVGMARWLWKVTKPKKDETPDPMPAELAIVTMADPDQPTLAPELEREAIALRTDIERVTLPIVDQPFPDWRRIVLGHHKAKIDVLGTTPEMCSRLGKLVGVDTTLGSLRLTLGGRNSAVRFDTIGAVPMTGFFAPLAVDDEGEA